jgi:hypothetical protein
MMPATAATASESDDMMRFAIGEVRVDVIVDDDDFELPLGSFLPGATRLP